MFTNKLTRGLLVLPALAVAGTVLAACGGSPSASPGVASLGSASASNSGAPASADPSKSGFQQALDYAKCMRAHGLTSFPDPKQSDGGGIEIQLGTGQLDPNSPTFQKAQEACKALAPGGGPGAADGKFDPTKIGAWTACIRKNGEPGFPDPTNTGSGLKINLTGSGVDPNTMQKALGACKSLAPGGQMQIMAGTAPGVGKPGDNGPGSAPGGSNSSGGGN